jgi:AcrR family transcriptional regulator
MSNVDTRHRILDTAIKVSVDQGIKGLTIDNVAKAVGLSKGGVFYHFKTKEDLLVGMVNHIIDQFEFECQRLQQEEGMDPLTATVHSSMNDSTDQRNRICAMVAAVAHDRSIPSRTSCRFEDWIREMESAGCQRGTALLVAHSIDGFFIACAFEMGTSLDADRELLKAKLLEIIAADERYWYIQAFRHAIKVIESDGAVERTLASV